MNLLSGLEAAANFGQGYLGGQQQAKTNQYTDTLRQLSLENATQQNQQNALGLQHQAALAQASKALATGNQGNLDPLNYTLQLAKAAAADGDVVGAEQYYTQAANLQTAQIAQQQKVAATQEGDLKRQAQSYSYVASVLGDPSIQTPQEFHARQLQVLSSPLVTPDEKQNIAKMQFSPQLIQRVRAMGMTAAQQAQAKLGQQKLALQQQQNDVSNQLKAREVAASELRARATAEHLATVGKTGGSPAIPSKNDVMIAQPLVQQAYAENGGDAGSVPSTMMNDVAAQALQLVKANRGINYTQAVRQVLSRMQQSGQLAQGTQARTFLGFNTGTEKTAKYASGQTTQDPIPFTGQPQSSLLQGHYYNTNKGVLEWNGTGWMKP